MNYLLIHKFFDFFANRSRRKNDLRIFTYTLSDIAAHFLKAIIKHLIAFIVDNKLYLSYFDGFFIDMLDESPRSSDHNLVLFSSRSIISDEVSAAVKRGNIESKWFAYIT